MLARLALGRELHEAYLILLLAEIDFPAVLPVLTEADPASVRAALAVISMSRNEMFFEANLEFFYSHHLHP